ncbi:MarR family transcriptional regulator [Rhodococcus rhodnii]|uniref:HTH marR-type domain-containing protein n=2 Tax=Rhodococcus rhodnii TaxID=38312 RepID=R7WT81_9NOCA|nr:MarR family transcriptional regulator [Rhodococcus rhodnii]EOM77329.1 hypothetical protein Rrhod_1282 [Rhodococcus rhodnii LMG 5362]TXG91706.1 MarR family transcriptional regulator [Rhodococcus rhodnii]
MTTAPGRPRQAADAAEVRPALALLRAARLATEALAAAVEGTGLTVDQWLTLELLATRSGDGLAMNELRALTGMSGATLTRTVDKLIAESLAHREVDPFDRRRILVHVSRRGAALHAATAGDVDAADPGGVAARA